MRFDSGLEFKQHINDKINNAYNIIGLIKHNLLDISTQSFVQVTGKTPTCNMLIQFGHLSLSKI